MHYLWTAIVGLIAGGLGKMLLPGKDPGGILVTMLIGIGGSFLGDYVSGLLGITLFNGLIGAVLGSIIILLLWRFISSKLYAKRYLIAQNFSTNSAKNWFFCVQILSNDTIITPNVITKTPAIRMGVTCSLK